MLLDSQLVEKFHALHRQRLSGCLVAEGEGFRLEICLVEGEPVAVDIGCRLDEAFADFCRTYHKIDDSGLAELRAAIAGGAKGRTYLVERQLISDAEADQIDQAVIDDTLCRSFRGPCTGVAFTAGKPPETLAIGQTAVRMRIAVEALIRTCDQQAAESQAVEQEIGNWNAVFALSEGEHVSGQLSEYEKMVLNFIDGKSNVESIAELCRDSSLNLARVLRSLVVKKVIHRVAQSGAAPALPQSSSPTAESADRLPAAVSGSARQIDITPYHAPREQTGSRLVVLVGLITLLAILIGVALLVVQYNRSQDRMRADQTEIAECIRQRDWGDARTAVARIRQEAGNDVAAVRVVDNLGQQVEDAIHGEIRAIKDLIAGEDFAAARKRIAKLPDDEGLDQELTEAEGDARDASLALTKEVNARLGSGDVAGALAALDAASPKRQALGATVLSQWIRTSLERAADATQPLQPRLVALAQVRQARPDAEAEARLAALESELQGQMVHISERLDELEKLAVAGSYAEVADEMAKMRIGSLGVGSDVEARAAHVNEAVRHSESELRAAAQLALDTIASGEIGAKLEAQRTAMDVVLKTYPRASGREGLERIMGALAACAGSGARTVAGRAAEAKALSEQVPESEPALAEALRTRVANLGKIEEQARMALDDARRLGHGGDLEGEVAALEQLIGQSLWQFTEVRKEAEQELDQTRSLAAKRVQQRADLAAALRRGDIPTCERLGREIGLSYLPLLVSSRPDGAEVVDGDGKVLGRTPLVLDVTADQRVDMKLTLRHDGFEPALATGAQAEGGWRLSLALKRAPELAVQLGHPLTARPAVIAGALWLADRGRVVRFTAPSKDAASTMPIEAAAQLAEPVFAPMTEINGRPLLATRERVAVRVGADGALQRVPLPVPTDLAPLVYRSQVVVDRELMVVAGRDGRLYAVDAQSRLLWQSAAGAAFSTAPVLHGETILVVRQDGRLERFLAEDGRNLATVSLPGAVIASWAADKGFAGLTAETVWAWDGEHLSSETLPEQCLAGGPGVVVTTTGKALLRGDKGWSEAGRLDPRPLPGRVAGALVWAGHAVVATGSVLQVVGPIGFRLDAGSELLPPVLWGGNLVVTALEGGVWIYKP